jgi:outer membrane protein OmpA-like peptidoglycan-associated protein
MWITGGGFEMKGAARLLFAIAAVIAMAGAANGQDAWNGTAGLLRVKSASTVGRGKLIFSLGSSYYRSAETLTKGPSSLLNGTSFDEAEVDYNFFFSRAALTFGLNDYVEISAALEIRNWIMQVGDEYAVNGVFETKTRGGLGDTDLLFKLCPPLPTRFVSVGVLAEASLPTGREEARFTTGNVDFGLKGLLTFDVPDSKSFVATRLHLNLGYRFNGNEEDGYGILYANNPDSSGFYPSAYPKSPEDRGDNFNNVVQFGAGLEFLARQSSLFMEFTWDNFRSADFLPADTATYYLEGSKDVYTLTPGVKLVSENGIGLMLATDFSLNPESNKSFLHVPDWAVYFTLSFGANLFAQDRDKDGIENKVDKCPNQPEDFDGVDDADGCPDLDNDKDSIPDGVDKCPDLIEDFDGFQDDDGCPDLDNDGDGVVDARDKCPNEPEDFDGIDDADGCPDVVQDSDNDGIADDRDKCPLKAEDMDGFQDADGCADWDNDLDGVPDSLDTCPSEPETYNGYVDADGCPDERPIEENFVLRDVYFESGSAVLAADSYSALERIVKSLEAYPDVRVEVAGFTDNVGGDEYNVELSRRRAESVKQYLASAGINAGRIVTRGYGKANPVSSNDTPEGRAENRRIELHRLQ